MDDSIRYDPDTNALIVGDVSIDDPEVIREAARWTTGERGEPVDLDDLAMADLSAFASQAITVGARVLAIAAQNNDTLAVQQAVRTASEQVNDVVNRAAAAADLSAHRAAEAIGATAREVHAGLSEQITRLVGGENPELMERLRPILARVGTDLESQVGLGIEKANEALHIEAERRHSELADLIRRLHQDVIVQAAEDATALAVRGATTLKGFAFEDELNAVFSEIASSMGDEYQITGESAGRLPRNKKGDGVFHIDGGVARVVMEAHDGTSKDWGSYLAEAERNRDASASIGVIRHVKDNGGHSIRVIGPRRVIVAFDPAADNIDLIRTVVLLMRAVALTSTGKFGTQEVAVANGHIGEALGAIKDLDEVKRSANAINGHASKIEMTATRTITTIQRELHSALNALTGAGGPTVVPEVGEATESAVSA